MSRTGFAFMMVGIAAAILALMWFGWRGRAKHNSGIVLAARALVGSVITEFTGVQYVSTTPLGSALDRVSIPGLRFKGLADVAVRSDGVTITVTGEATVTIPASDLIGTSRSNGRVGKAVEAGGLSVLEWRSADGRELESGFRFADPKQQNAFDAAIAGLTGPASAEQSTQPNTQTTAAADSADANDSPHLTDTTQEDA